MSYDDRHDDRYRGSRGSGHADPRYAEGYANDEYDDYDEYDEIDDDYPDPQHAASHVGDAETLLRRAIDIIANAPTMPLSSSPRIDRDEIIELLDEALARLPEELRQARWMLKERQDFVNKPRREANEMLEAARVQAERMVQRTEVVRAAEQRARHVVETADNDSRRLKLETEDFLDQRLASFEILLDKLGKTVAAGRQKLSIGSGGVGLPLVGDGDEDPTKGFFDQDR
jgi:cell division septum initiation protein DivIVA